MGEGSGELEMEGGASDSTQDLLPREQGPEGPLIGQEGTPGDILLASRQGRNPEIFLKLVGQLECGS